MTQTLFGAFAKHSPESCPLNNYESKKIFLEIRDKLEKINQNMELKTLNHFICQY
jgi:hypothetical protein